MSQIVLHNCDKEVLKDCPLCYTRSNLLARRYEATDKPSLDSWWKAHNIPAIPEACLPTAGYIVQDKAAGFIYHTDSKVCFIENFISNPEASWEDRQAALDAVTNCLLHYALSTGFQYVIALTQSQAIFERAKRFGFKDQGSYRVLNLDLHESSI